MVGYEMANNGKKSTARTAVVRVYYNTGMVPYTYGGGIVRMSRQGIHGAASGFGFSTISRITSLKNTPVVL
jgi:hypothetical protein